MWPITKLFLLGPHKDKGGKTGGRREELRFSLPCLQPSVHRPFSPMTGGREGYF